MILLPLYLALAVDPAAVGTWEANVLGMPMTLVIRAEGSCTFVDATSRCATAGTSLTFSGDDGAVTYAYQVAGGTLTLSGADLFVPVAFARRGGAPAPASTPTPTAPVPAGPARAENGARGSFSKEAWGTTLALPGGWKAGEKDGLVLLGSDTEAGLIVVRYFPSATREQAIAEYDKGVHEAGIEASPTTPASTFAAKGGKAVAGELSGKDTSGQELRIRTIAVLTPFGGALSVSGITTPQQYATIKVRTEAVAQAATFKKPPKVSAIAGNYQFIYVSKSGSYSREASLTLCRSGRFSKRGELAGSGSAGSAVTSRGESGSWTAVGDANSGTVTLGFDGGGSVELGYQVSTNPADRSAYGAAVRFGSDLYQKTGDGGC